MSQQEWARSESYHNSFLIPKDDVLQRAQANNVAHGFPDIAVPAAQGKFLNLLALSIGAKRILEVGTLGGYSSIWLARALPEDGELVTLELDSLRAEVAQENIDHAGLSSKVKILVGPAAETLATLDPPHPFDFVFIDADKPSNLIYFSHAKRLVKKGGVIIVDNVIWKGLVGDPSFSDDRVEGIRKLLHALRDDKEIDATTISTVGDKGYDGFLYAIRR